MTTTQARLLLVERHRARSTACDRSSSPTNERLQDARRQMLDGAERLDDRGDHLGRRHARPAATASRRSRTASPSGGSTARGRLDIFVNHELSLRSRSRAHAAATTTTTRQVSRLRLNQNGAGVAQGRVRDPAERRLPALLLELPRRRRSRVRREHPPHERGGPRHRAPRRKTLAQPKPARERRARAGRRRRRLRREERRSTSRSTEWAATTTRTRVGIPGLRVSGRALGRRHVRRSRQSQLYIVQGRKRRRRLERRRQAVCLRRRRRRDQRLRRHRRRR